MWKNYVTAIVLGGVISSVGVVGIIINTKAVQAASTSIINATVRIPVCGDFVQEFPEECDNSDFGGQTCRLQGFDDGVLDCDPACDFDTSGCYGVAPPSPSPSPTPSPTPSPSPSPNPSPSDSPASSDSNSSSPEPTPTIIVTEVTTSLIGESVTSLITDQITNVLRALPQAILTFDSNNDGRLEGSEKEQGLLTWVNSWKEYIHSESINAKTGQLPPRQCDINTDSHCNVVDFSVLMYYIGDNT